MSFRHSPIDLFEQVRLLLGQGRGNAARPQMKDVTDELVANSVAGSCSIALRRSFAET